jgi:hypothetical protein
VPQAFSFASFLREFSGDSSMNVLITPSNQAAGSAASYNVMVHHDGIWNSSLKLRTSAQHNLFHSAQNLKVIPERDVFCRVWSTTG